MKKILFALVPCAALLFAACGDSKFEYHQTNFWPQKPQGIRVYADQQKDTIRLQSLDSWTLTSTAPEWLTVTPTECNVQAGYSASTLLTLTMEKNATGQPRYASIDVKAYDKISMPVVQLPFLNIIQPAQPDGANDLTEKGFEMTLKAQPKDTAVVFTVYQDNATLTSEAAWVSVETENFTAGKHRVKISVEENPEASKRTANLVLTSGGISTNIVIKQEERL